MEYYVSKNHSKLNGRLYSPELYTNKICLNPSYNVKLQRDSRKLDIILDSGAFQDLQNSQRLSFKDALERQLKFEKKVHFRSSYIVSYDRMVDESPTIQGTRRKRRVDDNTSEVYVRDTIDAAKYLADHRDELKRRTLLLSNQGNSADQYISCLKEILSFSESYDAIGFGSFCIIGQIPKYTNQYFETLERALPLIKDKGIRRIHIFGVGVFKTLIRTQALCHKYGILPSYDTSSLEVNAVYGRVFKPDLEGKGPAGVHLTCTFKKEDKYVLYHPADWAILNVKTASFFWKELNRLYENDEMNEVEDSPIPEHSMNRK